MPPYSNYKGLKSHLKHMDKNHQNPVNDTNGYTTISQAFVNISKSYDFKPTKKKLNPRTDLLKQIYSFYDTEQEVV